MTKRVILFNGPPSSGKDTAAAHVWSRYPNSHWFRMSQPLKAASRAFFGWDDKEAEFMEKHKDEKQASLFNWKYRDIQISLSEDWAKEKFGVNVLGRLAARRIQRSNAQLFVCSDSGFAAEAEPVVAVVGSDNVLLVQLYRTGRHFGEDSRSYISIPNVRTLKMYNNGTQSDLYEQLDVVVDEWLKL